jgi:hypothetical protein
MILSGIESHYTDNVTIQFAFGQMTRKELEIMGKLIHHAPALANASSTAFANAPNVSNVAPNST